MNTNAPKPNNDITALSKLRSDDNHATYPVEKVEEGLDDKDAIHEVISGVMSLIVLTAYFSMFLVYPWITG